MGNGYNLIKLVEEIMEGIAPEKIGTMPLRWQANKYTLLLQAYPAELFEQDVHCDTSQTLTRYLCELAENLFQKTEVDVRGYKLLSQDHWKILDPMIEREELPA